ncbi:MAG: hypothetical protein KA035_03890 [Candidatus Levybacteria bacterium]|nr:hypothetical protein [Candidatus Levybacteria bacterium]
MAELDRHISRRGLFKATLGAGAGALVGCGDGPQKSTPTMPIQPTLELRPTVTPNIPTVEPTIQPVTQEQYTGFSFKQKLDFIEKRGMDASAYPELPNYNPETELVTSVAHLYHSIAPISEGPESIINNTQFLNRSEYLQALQTEFGKEFTPEEAEKQFQERLEIVTDKNILLISRERVAQLEQEQLAKNPNLASQLDGSLLHVKQFESILFHAITHANNSQGDLKFDGFSLHFPGIGRVDFDTLDDFKFKGTITDTNQPLYITGGNEAITELIGRSVAMEVAHPYISFGSGYHDGANIVAQINERTGINIKEFREYNTNRSVEELIQRWGSSQVGPVDTANPIMALALTGLYVNGYLGSYAETVSGINQYLGLQNPIPTQKP